jgi:serine/threonine protein kinase
MSTSREELLDRIVRWEEANARGQAVELEELCRDCPEQLEELRRHVDTLALLSWLNQPLDETTASTPNAADWPSVDDDLPRTLGERYRLDDLVGMGGFGRVYKGFDTWLERPVAVKVPRVDRPVGVEEVDQCRLEAKKVARLWHPNIVPVHDVGRNGGSCFIVSEWIDGENLAARLRNGRLPFHEAARIAAEVADALGHAHSHGYLHRDVKPSNILLDRSSRAYLTDFGIAVLEAELLRDVGVAGTLPYMAPEQLDVGLGPADHRADIYALGVVVYEMLTGLRPFRPASSVELSAQILAGNPPAPRSIDASLPASLEEICLRALSKVPADRHAKADDLASELRAYLSALDAPARRSSAHDERG